MTDATLLCIEIRIEIAAVDYQTLVGYFCPNRYFIHFE